MREDDQWGESFCFAVNGVPFFAKGANWIPADTFATRLTPADYARLIDDAVAANMNMLRVWGGGIYEDDVFYDLCDERGICIWQDFIFACATYPTFDPEWMASVRAEAEDNVRRIRHHACLALWCGNNELEQGLVGDEWTAHTMSWEDYSRLYDQMLPAIVHELDPDTDYWPCSPHSPRGDRRDFNNPNWGDAHLWSVWHGRQPFEWYRTCEHRFNSEFGFQSFPEPRTVRTYTAPEDRNITSFVMEHHQRSGIGNSTIIHYMLDWFRLPTDFDMTLWLSQILQGMAIKYAVEHWRRAMPRGMGTLYWQLNDCWQVASWSSIDYFGNWKALHYMARHFFAPLLISGLEDLDKGTVEIHVTSDLAAPVDATVRWVLTDLAGTEIARRESPVTVGPRADHLVETLALRNWLDEFDARGLLLWLELDVDGVTVATNLVNFARPKHLELPEPTITAVVTPAGAGYDVTLETDRPSLWTWLELTDVPARYSDNFIHLRPGAPVTVHVEPSGDLNRAEFAWQLRVRSLKDTYK
ncbi:MAG: glycoside hydrolase family 2 protein [Caldilineaceae bacterium]